MMPESETMNQTGVRHISARQQGCDHRFDVMCVEGKFILDLWECRYCGQRIRRKKFVAG